MAIGHGSEIVWLGTFSTRMYFSFYPHHAKSRSQSSSNAGPFNKLNSRDMANDGFCEACVRPAGTGMSSQRCKKARVPVRPIASAMRPSTAFVLMQPGP
jgi:hypothetical protein